MAEKKSCQLILYSFNNSNHYIKHGREGMCMHRIVKRSNDSPTYSNEKAMCKVESMHGKECCIPNHRTRLSEIEVA